MAPYNPNSPPESLQDVLLTLDAEILLALIPPTVLAARGMRTFIDGYLAEGGGYDTATAALIAEAQAAGWPNTSIFVNVLGTTSAGSFTLPAVSLTASVSAPTLAGIQVGGFTLPSVSVQPVIAGPSLVGVQVGSFALPSVTAQPVIAAPSMVGIQGGSFTLPAVSVQPTVAAPSLTGVQVGAFSLPSITAQPVVSAPSLEGLQAGVGSFTMPAVTLTPEVAAASLVGVQLGSFALPSVTAQPTVTAPDMVGAQGGSFALPSVTAQPVVAAPSMTGIEVGAFTLPAVSLQPAVSAASLAGVQLGSFALPAVSLTPQVAAAALAGIQVGSFALPAISAQPTVLAPSLVGVEASAPSDDLQVSASGGNESVTISYVSGGTGTAPITYSIKWDTVSRAGGGEYTNTIDWATIQAATDPDFPTEDFVHTGRSNGTTYYYKVVATNAQGSVESAEVSAEATAPVTVLNESFDSGIGVFTASGGATASGGYVQLGNGKQLTAAVALDRTVTLDADFRAGDIADGSSILRLALNSNGTVTLGGYRLEAEITWVDDGEGGGSGFTGVKLFNASGQIMAVETLTPLALYAIRLQITDTHLIVSLGSVGGALTQIGSVPDTTIGAFTHIHAIGVVGATNTPPELHSIKVTE